MDECCSQASRCGRHQRAWSPTGQEHNDPGGYYLSGRSNCPRYSRSSLLVVLSLSEELTMIKYTFVHNCGGCSWDKHEVVIRPTIYGLTGGYEEPRPLCVDKHVALMFVEAVDE